MSVHNCHHTIRWEEPGVAKMAVSDSDRGWDGSFETTKDESAPEYVTFSSTSTC